MRGRGEGRCLGAGIEIQCVGVKVPEEEKIQEMECIGPGY